MASEETREGIDDIIDIMRKSMGLTLYEAKLYIALLQGARNPREASVKSGVPLPRIYDVVKVLEAKGFVERDPGGWYKPYTPRAIAAAALARVEEEARARARMILNVVDKLEHIAAGSYGEPGASYLEGLYKIAAAAASLAESGGPIYIGVGVALGDPDTIASLARGIMPVTGEIRLLVDPAVAGGIVALLHDIGVEYRIVQVIVDFIASPGGALIIARREGSLIGLRLPRSPQAEHLYRSAEKLFQWGSAPSVTSPDG